MHVKCIHELCSLFIHILIYLHYIQYYIHVFLLILGDLPMIPLFGLQICRKNLFCIFFLSFSDLNEVKRLGFFRGLIFHQGKHLEHWRPKVQMGLGGAATWWDRVTPPVSDSSIRCRRFHWYHIRLYLKSSIKIVPETVPGTEAEIENKK
jgi:hypothetical protein